MTSNAMFVLSTLERGEQAFLEVLWAFMENGLLAKHEFFDIIMEARELAHDAGIEAACRDGAISQHIMILEGCT